MNLVFGMEASQIIFYRKLRRVTFSSVVSGWGNERFRNKIKKLNKTKEKRKKEKSHERELENIDAEKSFCFHTEIQGFGSKHSLLEIMKSYFYSFRIFQQMGLCLWPLILLGFILAHIQPTNICNKIFF